jgi:hypothetical protein
MVKQEYDFSAGNPADKPKSSEWIAVLCLLGFFLIINVATCRWYPVVWADEVSFAEPGMNYAQTGEYKTKVWPYQPINTFPAVNCPLYSMALAGWLSILKPTLLAARGLNYLLAGMAGFLMWLISWRYSMLSRVSSRLALVVLVESGYGLTTAARGIRPDMLGAVLILGLALCLGMRSARGRDWLSMTISAMIVWTGLNAGLAIGLACLTVWLALNFPSWHRFLPAAFGVALGCFSLILFMDSHQVLANFLVTISSVTDHGRGLRLITNSIHNFMDDMSLPPLLLGSLICWLAIYKRLHPTYKPPIRCLAFLILLPPFVFNAAGHFVIFYSYLIFFPACLLFFILLEQLSASSSASGRHARPWLIGILALALALGLPLRLILSKCFYHQEAETTISATLKTVINSNDVVFTENQMFFAVRKITPNVFVPSQDAAPDNECFKKLELDQPARDAISVLIVSPSRVNQYTNRLGGSWKYCKPLFGDSIKLGKAGHWPLIGKKLSGYFAQAPNSAYPLAILRRE